MTDKIRKTKLTSLSICPQDTARLLGDGLKTVGDLHDYAERGNRLFFIFGISKEAEKEIAEEYAIFTHEPLYQHLSPIERLAMKDDKSWRLHCAPRAPEDVEALLPAKVRHETETIGITTIADAVLAKLVLGDLTSTICQGNKKLCNIVQSIISDKWIWIDMDAEHRKYFVNRMWLLSTTLFCSVKAETHIQMTREGFKYMYELYQYLYAGNSLNPLLDKCDAEDKSRLKNVVFDIKANINYVDKRYYPAGL